MRKLFFIATFITLAVGISQAQIINENFESGLPSSASAIDTKVTLSSGEWTVNNVHGKKDNDNMRAVIYKGGYLITPVLDRPGTITFVHRASGSNKHIVVEKSTDGGSTWTKITEVTVNSSTPYGKTTCNSNSAEDDTEVLIKFTDTDGSIYLDNVIINQGSASGYGGGGGGGDMPATGIQPVIDNDADLSLSVDNGNIIYSTPKGGHVSLDILTQDGHKVCTVVNQATTEGGKRTIPVKQNIKQGVYIVRLTFNGIQTKCIKMTME